MSKKLVFAFVLVLLVGAAAPAGADPNGYIEGELGVGFFYGTFDQDPNIQLLAGGTAEEFCDDFDSDPEVEHPFDAEPGTAPLRTFLNHDGSVDLKANDKNQPIHLYHTELNNAVVWIEQVCDDYLSGGDAPEAFASGTADLKVRVSIGTDGVVDVFNSVNGKAIGTDGTEYKVRASADLIVDDEGPVGDPRDFVSFEMHEIRR